LLPVIGEARPPARVCRRAACARNAAEPFGFCERCGALHAGELERLRATQARTGREIDRRFPRLLAALTSEHAATLPAHLAAHYRPGEDRRFVLDALHDSWMETIERPAERAAVIGDSRR